MQILYLSVSLLAMSYEFQNLVPSGYVYWIEGDVCVSGQSIVRYIT
jgi:hypothetical protein